MTTAPTGATRPARARRWPAGLGWALWALAMLGLAVVVRLDDLMREAGRPDLLVLAPDSLAPLLGAVGAATVGAVLIGHRPRHPAGWLLLAIGLSMSAAGAGIASTHYWAATGGPPPGAGLVALYIPATILIAMVCNGFLLLLTPTGSLPSPRWRWWAAVTGATPVALLLVVTLTHRPGGQPARVAESPLDLDTLDGVPLVAYQAAFAVAIVAFVVAAASLVVRFRRARGVERQQLKWVALATVAVALLSVAVLVALALGAFAVAPLAGGLCPPILSAGIGAAVLRYRLYDLDRIISRTLAYGLLTVLLGGGYAGLVLGLGQLLDHDSPLVVATATLTLAGAFQPARGRIQQEVDRHFNRRRYDAERMIDAFGARLRQQVDLDTLTAELLAVIDQAMQPTTVSVWLRSSGGAPSDRRRPGRAGHGRP